MSALSSPQVGDNAGCDESRFLKPCRGNAADLGNLGLLVCLLSAPINSTLRRFLLDSIKE